MRGFEPYILNRENLERLISNLQDALAMGFSISLSFPADPLLEIMIDACLQLRQIAQEEGPWHEVSNPELEFLEKPLKLHSGARSGIWATTPDALGNVAQKSRQPGLETVSDPRLPDFFKQLASTLVELKHLHHLPTHLYCEERGERRNQPAKKITPKTYWYLKRRKDRLRKHNTHQNRKG